MERSDITIATEQFWDTWTDYDPDGQVIQFYCDLFYAGAMECNACVRIWVYVD